MVPTINHSMWLSNYKDVPTCYRYDFGFYLWGLFDRVDGLVVDLSDCYFYDVYDNRLCLGVIYLKFVLYLCVFQSASSFAQLRLAMVVLEELSAVLWLSFLLWRWKLHTGFTRYHGFFPTHLYVMDFLCYKYFNNTYIRCPLLYS